MVHDVTPDQDKKRMSMKRQQVDSPAASETLEQHIAKRRHDMESLNYVAVENDAYFEHQKKKRSRVRSPLMQRAYIDMCMIVG